MVLLSKDCLSVQWLTELREVFSCGRQVITRHLFEDGRAALDAYTTWEHRLIEARIVRWSVCLRVKQRVLLLAAVGVLEATLWIVLGLVHIVAR